MAGAKMSLLTAPSQASLLVSQLCVCRCFVVVVLIVFSHGWVYVCLLLATIGPPFFVTVTVTVLDLSDPSSSLIYYHAVLMRFREKKTNVLVCSTMCYIKKGIAELVHIFIPFFQVQYILRISLFYSNAQKNNLEGKLCFFWNDLLIRDYNQQPCKMSKCNTSQYKVQKTIMHYFEEFFMIGNIAKMPSQRLSTRNNIKMNKLSKRTVFLTQCGTDSPNE